MTIREAISTAYQATPTFFEKMATEVVIDPQAIAHFIVSGEGLTVNQAQSLLTFLNFNVVKHNITVHAN